MLNVEIRGNITVIFTHRSLDIIHLKSSKCEYLAPWLNYIILERTINNFVFNSVTTVNNLVFSKTFYILLFQTNYFEAIRQETNIILLNC